MANQNPKHRPRFAITGLMLRFLIFLVEKGVLMVDWLKKSHWNEDLSCQTVGQVQFDEEVNTYFPIYLKSKRCSCIILTNSFTSYRIDVTNSSKSDKSQLEVPSL